jgi:hypothetical protein
VWQGQSFAPPAAMLKLPSSRLSRGVNLIGLGTLFGLIQNLQQAHPQLEFRYTGSIVLND